MDDFTPHDGETDPFKLAEQKRWLDLARLGSKTWNIWADREVNRKKERKIDIDFSGSIIETPNFGDFVFPYEVDFSGVQFLNRANFFGTKFYKAVYFSETDFLKGASFFGSIFTDDASFLKSTFSEDADFFMAIFYADAHFRKSNFLSNANFNGAIFYSDADFSDISVKSIWQLGKAQVAGSLEARSSKIEGPAYFTAIQFKVPPDFVSTAFKQPPSFLDRPSPTHAKTAYGVSAASMTGRRGSDD